MEQPPVFFIVNQCNYIHLFPQKAYISSVRIVCCPAAPVRARADHAHVRNTGQCAGSRPIFKKSLWLLSNKWLIESSKYWRKSPARKPLPAGDTNGLPTFGNQVFYHSKPCGRFDNIAHVDCAAPNIDAFVKSQITCHCERSEAISVVVSGRKTQIATSRSLS